MNDEILSNQGPLPNLKRCLTKYLGQTHDLSKCLVEDSEGCVYAVVRFSSGVICRHPDRRSFEATDLP
jgi:hypothetical protein